MPKLKNDSLFTLVKSLSKTEKRHFRISHSPAKKNRVKQVPKQDKPPLYLQLFNVLDKSSYYKEKEILNQIPELKKQQLSNLKAHLYQHILETLRILSRQKDVRIHIRQLVDYAQVL